MEMSNHFNNRASSEKPNKYEKYKTEHLYNSNIN
jgi:hypothetical protein